MSKKLVKDKELKNTTYLLYSNSKTAKVIEKNHNWNFSKWILFSNQKIPGTIWTVIASGPKRSKEPITTIQPLNFLPPEPWSRSDVSKIFQIFTFVKFAIFCKRIEVVIIKPNLSDSIHKLVGIIPVD